MKQWYTRDWTDYEAVKNNPASVTDLHDALEEAVHRQLMSDVPYGCLLYTSVTATTQLLPGPHKQLLHQWISIGTFTFQYKHFPNMGTGTTFPLTCPQW